VALVRTQGNFPSPGELLEPYGNTPFVAGAMRGSHYAPLYPVRSDPSEIPSYFDGPALVKALGIVVNDGTFGEPVYPFDASVWDDVRNRASKEFRRFRNRQGPFGPGTVPAEDLEYGGWTDVVESLEGRWKTQAAASEVQRE
jgi:fructose 1,6-bisphosphate aldolase/phosphatase